MFQFRDSVANGGPVLSQYELFVSIFRQLELHFPASIDENYLYLIKNRHLPD